MNGDGTGEPFSGQVADTIAKALSGQHAEKPQISREAPPAPPAPAAPQPEASAPQDPEKPAVTISTAPVGDVAARFATPTTDVPEVKHVEMPADTPIEQPEGMTDKANYAWQELRAREKQSRQAAEALKAQLDEMAKQATAIAEERVKFADELKQRDDRIAKLEEDLGKLDLAHRPEFRKQYDEPLDEVRRQISDLLKDTTNLTEDDKIAQTAERLVTASDADFNRLVGQLPASVQGSFLDKRREFQRISSARDNAITEWRTSQAGLQVVGDQRQIVERSQRRREIAESAIAFAKEVTPPDQRLSVLTEQTYVDDVAKTDTSFRGFMQTASDEEIARAAYQGFLVPVLQRQLAFMAEAMNEFRTAYHRMRGVTHPPALPMRVQTERTSAPAPVSTAPVVPKEGSLQQAIESVAEQAAQRLVR